MSTNLFSEIFIDNISFVSVEFNENNCAKNHLTYKEIISFLSIPYYYINKRVSA